MGKLTSFSEPNQLVSYSLFDGHIHRGKKQCLTLNVPLKACSFGRTNSYICVRLLLKNNELFFALYSLLYYVVFIQNPDHLSTLHFCYILQFKEVMIFIHKTELFLYSDINLKEVRANKLSL